MFSGQHLATIFKFFFKAGLRAKRSKLFLAFSFIPVLVILIIKGFALSIETGSLSGTNLFTQVGLSFYFHLFIQILALFYGCSVINDEIDNKTLIYLTTSTVSKTNIIVGKYLAQLVTSIIIINFGLFCSFVVANFNRMSKLPVLNELFTFMFTGILALAAYSALFTLAGSLLKKPVISGIIYIFGYETVVQFLPGSTQKLALNHYISSLLPASQIQKSGFLRTFLKPSASSESIVMLLALTIIFLIIAAVVFTKKEHILSDSN